MELRPLPRVPVTQAWLRKEALGRVRDIGSGLMAIRMPGHHALTEVTDCLLNRIPAMERGAFYADIRAELFDSVESYLNREPRTIGCEDAANPVGTPNARFLAAARGDGTSAAGSGMCHSSPARSGVTT
jgi:hypothetical protein